MSRSCFNGTHTPEIWKTGQTSHLVLHSRGLLCRLIASAALQVSPSSYRMKISSLSYLLIIRWCFNFQPPRQLCPVYMKTIEWAWTENKSIDTIKWVNCLLNSHTVLLVDLMLLLKQSLTQFHNLMIGRVRPQWSKICRIIFDKWELPLVRCHKHCRERPLSILALPYLRQDRLNLKRCRLQHWVKKKKKRERRWSADISKIR